MEMKRDDMNKPYDPKKSVWVPDGEGGFKEALLQSEEGGKSVVMVGHEVRVQKVIYGRVTKGFWSNLGYAVPGSYSKVLMPLI